MLKKTIQRTLHLLPIVLSISVGVMLFLLIQQNIRLKQETRELQAENSKDSSFYRFNMDLGRYLGKPLPVNLETDEPKDHESTAGESTEGGSNDQDQIVMVFNPMVCGKHVEDGLQTLTRYAERLEENRLATVAMIGVAGLRDKSFALRLRSAGHLPIPFVYKKAEELRAAFPLETEHTYVDTPIYFWIGADQTVKAAFKPGREDSQSLDAWLGLLLS